MSWEKWKGQWKRKRGQIWQISKSYFIILLFLLTFFMLLKKGTVFHEGLAKPQWASIIALLIVLPFIYSAVMKYFAPRLTGIKISNLVELRFKEAEAESVPLDELNAESTDWIKNLNDNLNLEHIDAITYANTMTSLASVIIDTVKQIEQKEYDSLVIDLNQGKNWVTANLYFFALLVAKRTLVKQIIFVETAQRENEFAGMCSPEELLLGLEGIFPDYRTAAGSCNFFDPELGIDVSISYFSKLRKLWENKKDKEESYKLWLTSSSLCSLVGKYLHWYKIEHKDSLTEQDYRHILFSSRPYIAVVRDGQFLRLLNRDKVALIIAREMIERSTIYV